MQVVWQKNGRNKAPELQADTTCRSSRNSADEVKACLCLKPSYLLSEVQVYSLRINIRVHHKNELGVEEFSNSLLQIKDGSPI